MSKDLIVVLVLLSLALGQDTTAQGSDATSSNTIEPTPADTTSSNTTDPSTSSNTTDIIQDSNTTTPDSTNTTDPVPSQLTCPKFTCSRNRSSTCLTQTTDGWQISQCNRGYECKFSMLNISGSFCELEVESPEDESELCYSGYILPGANCTANDYCQPGYFCDTVTSTCAARALLGANCSQTYQCEYGSICNYGICINQLSLSQGNSSETSVACSSGIVLNSTCQAPQLTNGTLPKTCTSDIDCLSSDGITPGTCQCGADINGTAYCAAHRSDMISLRQLKSSYNGIYEEIVYYTYKLNYFHIIKSEILKPSVEDCLDESIETEKFEDLEEFFEICSPACTGVNGCVAELGFY